MRVLFVHGVGHMHETTGWEKYWEECITQAVESAGGDIRSLEICCFEYKKHYDDSKVTFEETREAFEELVSSTIKYAVKRVFGAKRGVGPIKLIKDTAGMVVQFVADDEVRKNVRTDLRNKLDDFKPHILLGHSLGSLICYDVLQEEPRPGDRDMSFFSFGSQIAFPAVLGQWRGGKLSPLDKVEEWFHLYNRRDIVATFPISANLGNITPLVTEFGNFMSAHEGHRYVLCDEAIEGVWRPTVMRVSMAGRSLEERSLSANLSSESLGYVGGDAYLSKRTHEAQHKALIIGVDEYEKASSMPNLEGCVNDAFEMSAALQCCDINADNIRLITNSRATGSAIRERLSWLLDDAKPGDVRVLTFSGHGVQLAEYDETGSPAYNTEGLCPHDFNWTSDSAITDEELFSYYAQMDYGVHLMMFLDCCHSGGITRGGGLVRGVTPPDDVRHRALKWDESSQMWVKRDWKPVASLMESKPRSKKKTKIDKKTAQFIGEHGDVWRLGSALPLRDMQPDKYDELRDKYDHHGPYMPLIMMACGESELASEYGHGSVSYGVFTWAITRALRRLSADGSAFSYKQLLAESKKIIQDRGFEQSPEISGPSERVISDVPFLK